MLVVDDDDDLRRSTALILVRHGYVCCEAASSAEARAVVDFEQDVAVVLCDISMPGGSGIELLRWLTADFPDLAVVMMTAVDDSSVAETAFDLGAFGYVTKPFEPNQLLIGLSGALRRRELEADRKNHLHALEDTIARTQLLNGVVDELGRRSPEASVDGAEEIERLSLAVSLRDEETGRHLERMSRYAVVLAQAVGFTAMPLDDLRVAIALHDVGKIGVPDGVLLKPGPLSPDEYAAMQRHAQIGFQLLAGSTSELLLIASDIAMTHHEWWDGHGYPRGLEGTEISEAARIAAVADVFDALTSDRVYRPALTFDEAIAIMSELRGRQFEPRLLDAFVGSMGAIAEIRVAYPDLADAQGRIRILVVDDHEIFVHSLVRLLGSKTELKVVGTAGNVAAAVAAASSYSPDVVLMDFELPDGDGPQATRLIKALMPAVHVIMLTARTDDDSLVRAIAAGCSGFVRKEDTVEQLLGAIIAVRDGEPVEPGKDLTPLLRQLRPTGRGLGADISPRELEVLRLMATGIANKQLARLLGLRLNTVRNHSQSILGKLQAHSRMEAVATAVREGIISFPNPSST
ncbi:MAG: Response regulator with domain [Acidimicrobiales bacterium]|nr:Response regulator with domain [Acidimicrobiales bacterium]